jgi:hypothetical protein
MVMQERLTELFRELQTVASRINEELGDISSAVAGLFPPAGTPLSRDAPIAEHSHALLRMPKLERHLPTEQDTWADVFDLPVGPWGLHLSGTALPDPQLAISMRANELGAPSIEPFLTLVRPAEGLETVNLDSPGDGRITLPAGQCMMLLQADEIWKVRLSFRDGR